MYEREKRIDEETHKHYYENENFEEEKEKIYNLFYLFRKRKKYIF